MPHPLLTRIVEASDVLPLRAKVLYPDKSPKECRRSADKHALHLGTSYGTELIAVASLYEEQPPGVVLTELQDAPTAWRITDIATNPEFRQRGAATGILRVAKDRLTEQDADLLWAYVPDSVAGFFEAHDFITVGDTVELPEHGHARIMYWSFRTELPQ